eukprot:GDKI01025700.1.p1 GENE.GDKI01025700.1~~GDKI01025700.1.p1  ORF type:complete len:237 (+),score=44.98 GDKI01025700.1:65-775(+)
MSLSLIRRPAAAAFSRALPRRALEEYWRGGYMDPNASPEDKEKNASSGDAWPAALLRMKSFDDLHKLWYVLLKEKNFLMSERLAYWQYGAQQPSHGRLKKVKMSMKRILTVLSRREIHQQCLRAKQMLKTQELREQLETQRFHLEEQMKQLRHKIERMGNQESLMKNAWRATLQKCEADHAQLLVQLKPIRKETMQLLIPDWRYQRKYSDLAGPVTWKQMYVRALASKMKKPIRFY